MQPALADSNTQPAATNINEVNVPQNSAAVEDGVLTETENGRVPDSVVPRTDVSDGLSEAMGAWSKVRMRAE
eukprot:scaffold170412_cov54-Prasinocladus_malaysianus.AAC.1